MPEVESLRSAIEELFVVEREGWAYERIQRVTEALQRDVAPDVRFESLVVWFAEHNAFTAPGNTLYVSRRLLERLADDDAAAFIVAHEIAHHRLGHISPPPENWRELIRAIAAGLERAWRPRPEDERAADLLAIEMCVAAGYDVERCVATLAYLEQVALDYGNVDAVLGAEDGQPGSHPPLRTRVEDVRAHAGQWRRDGAAPQTSRSPDRERRAHRERLRAEKRVKPPAAPAPETLYREHVFVERCMCEDPAVGPCVSCGRARCAYHLHRGLCLRCTEAIGRVMAEQGTWHLVIAVASGVVCTLALALAGVFSGILAAFPLSFGVYRALRVRQYRRALAELGPVLAASKGELPAPPNRYERYPEPEPERFPNGY